MTRADRQEQVHYVYRCFDASRRLIYVGCTTNLQNRMAQHTASSWWAPQVAKVTAKVFPNGPVGRQAERVAIRDEVPRWNKASKWVGRANWAREDWHDWFVVLLRDGSRGLSSLDRSARDYQSLFASPLPPELAVLMEQAREQQRQRATESEARDRQRAKDRALLETQELRELNDELRHHLDRQMALAEALGIDWHDPEVMDPSAAIDAELARRAQGVDS